MRQRIHRDARGLDGMRQAERLAMGTDVPYGVALALAHPHRLIAGIDGDRDGRREPVDGDDRQRGEESCGIEALEHLRHVVARPGTTVGVIHRDRDWLLEVARTRPACRRPC
jgi:hypothetical protein